MEVRGQVYLLAGSETQLKEEFLNSLKSRLFDNSSSCADYAFFYAQEITQLSSVLETAYTYPLLSSQRIMVIKNIEQFKEEDKALLLKYAHNPGTTSILILETPLNDLRGEFWKRLSQRAEVHYFKKQDKREAYTGFDLLRAVNQKQAGRAIEILNALWQENKSGGEILGLLTWHFRRLLKVKQLEGKYPSGQLGVHLNIKNGFQLEMLLKEARLFSRERLEYMFRLLTQADLSLRSHRSSEKYILEFLLVKMCDARPLKDAPFFARRSFF